MKSVAEAFKEGTKAFGFNEITNPFIYFFKHYGKEFNLTAENYIFLHNLVADSILSKSELNVLQQDSSNSRVLGRANLLFNKHLYQLNSSEATELIKIQQEKVLDSYAFRALDKVTQQAI
jgi:hypothetical protein